MSDWRKKREGPGEIRLALPSLLQAISAHGRHDRGRGGDANHMVGAWVLLAFLCLERPFLISCLQIEKIILRACSITINYWLNYARDNPPWLSERDDFAVASVPEHYF